MYHKGDTAPKAARIIHTDFEKRFIRARVIKYQDFIAHEGEKGVQRAGLLATHGRDYVVADGDIIHFVIG